MARFGFGLGFRSQASTFAPIFGSESAAFVSTWNTENLGGTGSATKVILLPMTAGVEVDWGDGTVNNLNTHTYAAGGIKTITIADAFTGFRFNGGGDELKIITISASGGMAVDSSDMFKGCSNMTTFISSPITVTTSFLTRMFRDCSSLVTADLSGFDTSIVTDLTSFLQSTTSMVALTFGGSFVTDLVQSFSSCFSNCQSSNIDVSSFNTESATNFSFMFQNAGGNIVGVEDFNVANVTTMSFMFNNETLPTVQYSNLLINYEAQSVQNNVALSGGNSLYSVGAATTARANLIADHTWSITDGGQEP